MYVGLKFVLLIHQHSCFWIVLSTQTMLSVDRSHAIFTVWVKVIYTDPGGHKHYRKGKLNLVDLAGSERHGKTGK